MLFFIKNHYFKTLLLAYFTASAMTSLALTIGENAPDFKLQDADGKIHKLSQYKGTYVVLEWTNYECPFVVKHYDSGNMQSIQKEFVAKDVVWLSICSSGKGNQGNFSKAKIKENMAKCGAACSAYLIDEDGKVGKMYGAKTTPHMFVINPEGELIYQGAIDSIASYKKEDIAQAENYVALALKASLAGKKIAKNATKSYGCSVKYGDK